MHVKINVCDSVIGTLINIQGNTKHDKNACLDMIDMSIRQEFALEDIVKITYFPPTCHTISRK